MRKLLFFWCLIVIVLGAAFAGTPFPVLPDWESGDAGSISTGGALVDLDRDGWLDLVVSNGNDMQRQPLVVYYNRGDGTFPDLPDWSSLTEEYHGQLAAGDVNRDGWIDIAVSIYLGPRRFVDPGRAVLYLNDGAGNLPSTPTWESADDFFSFTPALGDADGDGDLDLAVAVGEPYGHEFQPDNDLVFFNEDGTLEDAPSWVSDELEHSMAAAWGDADDDGDLDLAFSGCYGSHKIYYQGDAGLETAYGWQSDLEVTMGVRLSFGDLDRDGFTDLAVSENNQLGGEGHFRIFPGTPTGLSTTDSWNSAYSGYGSVALLGDVNDDGWLDLLGGGWGADDIYSDQVRIYPNRYTQTLEREERWTSGTGSVVERILLGDVDNDGLRYVSEVFAVDGTRKLFTVERIPFREIRRITVDGEDLGPDRYCYDPERGWVSLAAPPIVSLEIDYSYSTRLDMVVLNWDDEQGNFLFYSREPPFLFAEKGATGTELRLYWTGGLSPFDVLESRDPSFGPGLEVKARDLDAGEWSDLPGTLHQGGLLFYKVY